jgi:hypothetical protein
LAVKKKLLVIVLIVIGFGLVTAFSPLNNTCSRALPHRPLHCQELESQILAATVRIQFHGWIEIEDGYNSKRIDGTLSHATIARGRYLVTHNHFGIPLSKASRYGGYGNGGFTSLSVYKLDGEPILSHAPLSTFSVVSEVGETTLLDFGVVDGLGLFARAGLKSSDFSTWEEIELRQDLEVAQIDKDEQGNTIVVWTRIKDILPDSEQYLLHLDNFLQPGASGGGVYVNGLHIGNNWSRIPLVDHNTREFLSGYSVVALNSDLIQTGATGEAFH